MCARINCTLPATILKEAAKRERQKKSAMNGWMDRMGERGKRLEKCAIEKNARFDIVFCFFFVSFCLCCVEIVGNFCEF